MIFHEQIQEIPKKDYKKWQQTLGICFCTLTSLNIISRPQLHDFAFIDFRQFFSIKSITNLPEHVP